MAAGDLNFSFLTAKTFTPVLFCCCHHTVLLLCAESYKSVKMRGRHGKLVKETQKSIKWTEERVWQSGLGIGMEEMHSRGKPISNWRWLREGGLWNHLCTGNGKQNAYRKTGRRPPLWRVKWRSPKWAVHLKSSTLPFELAFSNCI